MKTRTETLSHSFALNIMGKAKDIIVKPIKAADANKVIKRLHYSGKVVQNSTLHFGVFLNGKCGGALSYGHPIDRRNLMPLVKDTKFYDFLELNRMALADWLPRNGESRAIAYTMKFIKKNYPSIKWVISFSDGTQCGDGTIYRASGFDLIGIKKNSTIHKMPDGSIVAKHGTSKKNFTGSKPLSGYQLRYIYFIDKSYRKKLTVPTIPFNEINKRGASMYKGKALSVQSIEDDAPVIQTGEGGSTPT